MIGLMNKNKMKKNKPRIDLYFHCANCMNGHLAVGWTKEGVQVYCEDCKMNVADLDFKGQKIDYYNEK